MVRQPDATMQPTPQYDQLMSQHRVLGFKPRLRLEWRGQDGKNETEQPDHSVNLRDSITAATRMRCSAHTASEIEFAVGTGDVQFRPRKGPDPTLQLACAEPGVLPRRKLRQQGDGGCEAASGKPD